jgi:hypothetical protein
MPIDGGAPGASQPALPTELDATLDDEAVTPLDVDLAALVADLLDDAPVGSPPVPDPPEPLLPLSQPTQMHVLASASTPATVNALFISSPWRRGGRRRRKKP